MQILRLKNITNFVVFSDVHLSTSKKNLSDLFISSLLSLPKTDAIFLLGDIFDFIAVTSPYFVKLWQEVFETFKSLRQKGTQIYFVEGNHDFGFEHFKNQFLNECFDAYGDFIIELQHDVLGLVHLRHGDNVVCKPSYMRFRHFVKNKNFQRLASILIPGRVLQFIFSRYANISRQKDAYRVLSEEFLNDCLKQTLSQYPGLDVLIIGHIHILKDCLISPHVRFLVGPDWLSKPSYLIYNSQEGFHRVFN